MNQQPERGDQRRGTLGDDALERFSTPLTVIKGNSQLVRRWLNQRDVADADVALARLDMIETMVDRLVATISDLRSGADTPAPPGQQGTPPGPAADGRP